MSEPKTVEEALRIARFNIADSDKHPADDPIAIAHAKQKLIDDREVANRRNDVQQVLKSPEGRRFIWRVLSKCGTFSESFNVNNPRLTDFNEGQRSIGIYLLAMINDADTTAYFRMFNEHNSNMKSQKKDIGDNQ